MCCPQGNPSVWVKPTGGSPKARCIAPEPKGAVQQEVSGEVWEELMEKYEGKVSITPPHLRGVMK